MDIRSKVMPITGGLRRVLVETGDAFKVRVISTNSQNRYLKSFFCFIGRILSMYLPFLSPKFFTAFLESSFMLDIVRR